MYVLKVHKIMFVRCWGPWHRCPTYLPHLLQGFQKMRLHQMSINLLVLGVANDLVTGWKAHYESTVIMLWIIWAQGKKQAPQDLSEKSLCVCTLPASHGWTFGSCNWFGALVHRKKFKMELFFSPCFRSELFMCRSLLARQLGSRDKHWRVETSLFVFFPAGL